MVLSEHEAEARLSALRHQREAIDRQIADLALFLELGRRLAGPAVSGAPHEGGPYQGARAGRDAPPAFHDGWAREATAGPVPSPWEPDRAPGPAPHPPVSHSPAPRPTPAGEPAAGPIREAFEEEAGGTVSEGVVARRYGRALIEAALDALEEAGRPLHASEIFSSLSAQGFALPGQDPVAALNTRLWKRSGSGGPLRRLGDAVYALAEPGV